MKELIAGSDNALTRFVVNLIFQAQKADFSEALGKARNDLSEITGVSSALRSESKRQKILTQ